jgi:hypothetical protein
VYLEFGIGREEPVGNGEWVEVGVESSQHGFEVWQRASAIELPPGEPSSRVVVHGVEASLGQPLRHPCAVDVQQGGDLGVAGNAVGFQFGRCQDCSKLGTLHRGVVDETGAERLSLSLLGVRPDHRLHH